MQYPPLVRYPLGMQLDSVALGGLKQWITVDGNPQGPLLLYIHGGPGTAEIPVAAAFQSHLTPTFQVVNWDQRGAGKTAGVGVSLEQLINDCAELVQLLRARFPRRAVYLLGHSWGSLLGLMTLQRHPQLFSGFISVGQLVAGAQNEVLSHRLAIDKAKGEGRGLLYRALLSDHPPYGRHADALLRKCFYLYVLGGFFKRRSLALGLLLRLCASPHYRLSEKLTYLERFRDSLRELQPVIETLDLLEQPLCLAVPALFCVGCHDLVTPPELAKRLYAHIEAPYKQFELFENEAHSLHYEAPARFASVVLRWLETSRHFVPEAAGQDVRP